MTGQNCKIKILIVDDETVVRDFLTRFFRMKYSIEAKAVESGLQAVEAAKQEKFDLVLMDIRMPRMNGLETFSELKKINPDFTCVFMTGYAVEAELLEITKQAGTVCLKKPFEDIDQLAQIFNKTLENLNSPREGAAEQDKRAFVRLDVVLDVEYRLKQASRPFQRSLSRNISPGGIKLTIPEKLSPGTELELVMRLPGGEKALDASAEVVWCKSSQNKSGCYDAGIKFSEIDFPKLTGLLLHYDYQRQKA